MKWVIYLLLAAGALAFKTSEVGTDDLPRLNLSTKCNTLDLSGLNYSGIARSGYLSVGKNNSVLSFIFYGRNGITNPNDLNNQPTIIWLNGGPGESSQWGNFNEIGPLMVRRKLLGTGLEIVVNKNSWSREFNLLFVDQPIGTGLSYADPDYRNVFPMNTAGSRVLMQRWQSTSMKL